MPAPLDVRKLRVRSRAGNSLAWRRKAEAELRDVEVPSLRNSSAILCVRSLRLDRTNPTPHANSAGLGTVLSGALERLLQQAARPARGFVPAGAEAVVFADRAELLACLARDWLRGDTRLRWWWAALLARESAVEAVTRAWQSTPEHNPAALVSLESTNEHASFLRRLPPTTVAKLSDMVARTFALEDLKDAIQNAIELAAAHDFPLPETLASENILPINDNDSPAPTSAPWSGWVRCDSGLSAASQTLLVLSAMHVRAPSLARSGNFLQRVRNFSASVRRLSAAQIKDAATVEVGSMPSKIPAPPFGKEIGDESSVTRPQDSGAPDVSISRSPPQITETAITLPTNSPPTTTVPPASPEPSTHWPAPSTDLPQSGAAWECSTAWGGIFYLVNAALALELYGDFTRPRQPSLGLSVWDFLALLGRHCIGTPIEADKCWSALAQLAGRPANEELGTWFEPPAEWRVPDSWLAPFPERTGWTGGTLLGRVQLRHPAGFTVLDAPCSDADATTRLQTEGARFSLRAEDFGPLEPDRGDTPAGSMNWWIDLLASYLDARWCRALGEKQPNAARQIVFRHDAHVCVVGDRVTVRFSLAAHPLALRLAGLDRDPGWVPAAGMSIAFEYI